MKLINVATCMIGLSVAVSRDVCAKSIEAEFEQRYKAWREWVSKNSVRSTYTACKEYYDIIALGVSAIPFMIGKMEECFDDFHLSTAVSIVSKREFGIEEWPADCLGDSITAARMYINWWRVGRFQTGAQFRDLYARWCKLEGVKMHDDAAKVYRQIVNLGLPVLPYLVDVVEESPEFVVAISELSGGDMPKNAKPEECKVWWGKNKERYILPPSEDVIPQSHVDDAKISVALPNHTGGATTKNMNRKESTSAKDSRSDGGKVLCDDSN